MEDQLKVIDQVTSTGIDLAMRFGPRVLVAILILVAGYFVGGWAGRATSRMLGRFHLEPPVTALIERVARIFVFCIFAIVALQNLGVELLPLIAGLSVAGAGIALAAQGVLGNVVAGLTIIFTKPYRVGDYVSIVKEEGEVLAIDLFNTTLGHPDRSRVVIPNRRIVGDILHNYGRIRQLQLELGVAYGTDLPAALRVVQEVLERSPLSLKDPAPAVIVAKLAASAIVIGVRPWVNVADYGAAVSELNLALVEACRAKGISIPFPQREVRMLT
jgi:small conductance mechanosensitive channel